MTESEELTKQVDMVYKNLLEKFNPASRSLITAGKAYLKALHGAMSASKLYLDALTKVARHSQQGCWGGSSDIGMCLMQMVDVYKEVQSQQMNILKAFYVDLLVPLETNLDKDTKVLQSEQKKFLSNHKQKLETYTKASSQLKKNKKKNRANKYGMDKEIKQYQAVEEERLKLDSYVESSLQNAVTQERRRYGFILERQCSLARHYQAYHSRGASLLSHALDNWQGVSATRERLPSPMLAMLPSIRPRDEGIYSTPHCDDDAVSLASQVRRARSMDGSCQDLSTLADEMPSRPVTRARSEFNLDHHRFTPDPSMLRRSVAIPEDTGRRAMARALYQYNTSGDNQLNFIENDLIALIGEKNKGWQYGENLRTQRCGWFPVAYTEWFNEEDDSALGSLARHHLPSSRSSVSEQTTSADSSAEVSSEASSTSALHHHHTLPPASLHHSNHNPLPPSMFHNPSARSRHPIKHRSSSTGTIQVGAQCAASASDATATPAATATHAAQTVQGPPRPLRHRPNVAPHTPQTLLHNVAAPVLSQSSSHQHNSNNLQHSTTNLPHSTSLHTQASSLQNSSTSLQTIQTSTSDSSCSVDTVLYNHQNSHGSSPPRDVPLKTPNVPSNSSQFSASILSSLTNAPSLLSSRLQKRGSGNSSFHLSDDSGFSNESGNDSNPQQASHAEINNDSQPQTRNALSSRWVSSNSAFTCESEQISLSTDCSSFLACPASQLNAHDNRLADSRFINSSQDSSLSTLHDHHLADSHFTHSSTSQESSTSTLPGSVGRKTKHRDLSLPSLSVDHFVTIARRKVNNVRSPCAQKIAAQKGRRTLKRSSSLLCLNIDSCTGKGDETYDDVWTGDWKHDSLIDLSSVLPEPPSFQPPPIPFSNHHHHNSSRPPMPLPKDPQIVTADSELSTQSSSSRHFQQTSIDHSTRDFSKERFSQNSQEQYFQNSSSGNSTLTGSDDDQDEEDESDVGEEEQDEEVYMVVSDHRRELRRTVTRRQVARSLTWASPRPASSPPALHRRGKKLEESPSRSFRRTEEEKHQSQRLIHQENWVLRKPDPNAQKDSPPVPPRRKSSRPHCPIPTAETSSKHTQGSLNRQNQDASRKQQQDSLSRHHEDSITRHYQDSIKRNHQNTFSRYQQDSLSRPQYNSLSRSQHNSLNRPQNSFNRPQQNSLKRSKKNSLSIPQQQLQQEAEEQTVKVYGPDVNIFNYGDFLHRRLRCAEGAAQLDQRSLTTGNLCGPWYDLWGNDASVGDV